jgi:putative membrane protein
MIARWLLAALHLFGLAIGLGSVWARARALRALNDPASLHRVFYADTWWGISALVLISTGLVRAFGGFEKGTDYYLGNHFFLGKMFLLVLILALEIWPMVTLIRWRIQAGRNQPIALQHTGSFALISRVQAVLLLLMILAATAMARGVTF